MSSQITGTTTTLQQALRQVTETREYQQPKTFTADALAALRTHRWPGNVRELKNVIERAAILSADAPTVAAEHLMIQRRTSRAVVAQEPGEHDIHIPEGGKLLEDIEREAVAITLRLTNGNQSAAARMLGISRPTLIKRMSEMSEQRPVRVSAQ